MRRRSVVVVEVVVRVGRVRWELTAEIVVIEEA